MKVLICEDDRLLMRAMQIIVEREGYEVITAADGNEAFDAVISGGFDLMLVDIHLPYTSGLEVIKYLRQDMKSNIPVVVVSAISDDVIMRQANLLGADKYLVKPYDPKYLIEVINSLLNKA
jgi:DNA-binding response OmpR family regulator